MTELQILNKDIIKLQTMKDDCINRGEWEMVDSIASDIDALVEKRKQAESKED